MDENIMILAAEACKQLPGGAFLTTGEKANPMTIGWAQFGIVWGKPILTVFVRKSRHSHELIENGGCFTVSVPKQGEMKEALGICGKKSGRDTDKLAEANLTIKAPQACCVGGVEGCEIYFECKKLFSMNCDGMAAFTDEALLQRFYQGKTDLAGDPHDVYFGEIVAAYKA